MAKRGDKLGDRQAALTYGLAATALCLWGGTPVANKVAVAAIEGLIPGSTR